MLKGHEPLDGGGLLNLGDEQARGYIQRYLSAAVDEYGLDVLRMDVRRRPRKPQTRVLILIDGALEKGFLSVVLPGALSLCVRGLCSTILTRARSGR